MASFASLDRSLSRAVKDLHDHLWVAPKKDEAALWRRLEAGARGLDRHLGARGLISGAVRPLLRDFRKHPGGTNLFEFLHTTSNLASAVANRRRRPREAAKRASEVASSLCIGLSAAADRFVLVEEFESGKTDFQEFTTRLADVLEDRGVVLAGEFKRAANAAYNLHAIWDDRWSKEFQRLTATDAIGSAGFAAGVHVGALRVLGVYREVPHARLAPAVVRILEGLGAQR